MRTSGAVSQSNTRSWVRCHLAEGEPAAGLDGALLCPAAAQVQPRHQACVGELKQLGLCVGSEAHHCAQEAAKGQARDGLWREARGREDASQEHGHRAARRHSLRVSAPLCHAESQRICRLHMASP